MIRRERECSISQLNEYAELKGRLRDGGVFQLQLGYYAGQAVLSFAILGASFALLLVSQALWMQLFAAALLAVAFTRFAFIFHDAGHRQIFAHNWQNDYTMLVIGVIIGSSASWWFKTHNQHHSDPNNLDLDPSTALPLLAFSSEQARSRGAVLRFVTRFQVYYFFPLLCLEGMGTRLASVIFLIEGKSRSPLIEALGLVVHTAVYLWLVFTLLPVGPALTFIVVHQALWGLYMGSVFAPNHKGMLVGSEATRLDFFYRQVLSSRNIRPGPLVDFWFGGLNYQIEHHLFPNIPRNNMKQARTITKAFCAEYGISYHETNVRQSYGEVLSYLHEVVAQPGQTIRVPEELAQHP